MPVDRRSFSFLILLATALPVSAGNANESISLSLRQFTNMALQNSLRSRSAADDLTSNRLGWMSSRRRLTWPTLSAAASTGKAFSDTDAGTTVDTKDQIESLTLSQPLLTGTQLTVDGTWTKSRSDIDTVGALSMSRTKYAPLWTASITQPIFIFTGNESLRARREANIGWQSAQHSYWLDRLRIEFDARTLYYDLLLESASVVVEQKKYASAKLVNDTTRALVRAGKLAEVELVRAEIRSLKDQRQIQNSESDLEKAMNRAKDLISLPADQDIRLTSSLTYEPFTVPLDVLIRLAAENNPSLQITREGVELSEIALKRAREADRPQLKTTGAYSSTRDRSETAAPLDPYEWNVRMAMDWPIFDASQSRLAAHRAEIALTQAKRNYETQLRELNVAVQNAFLEIKRTEEQIADFGPQRTAAERNVNAIRLQYRNGYTRLTDVFDAENQLRELELEYLNLLVAFNTARDGLEVLIGTDVEDIKDGGKR